MLDVGAGDGRISRELHLRGLEVQALEPYAASGAALPYTLEGTVLAPRAYAAVVLSHVLEHLDRPFEALACLLPALAENGRIVVAVPLLDSLQARVGGDRWFHQDVPRHAVLFTREGLFRLLERAGFGIERTYETSLGHNLLGMTQTLLNLMTRRRNVVFRALKGDAAGEWRELGLSLLALPLALGIGVAAEACAMLARRSGAVVVVAVPRPARS